MRSLGIALCLFVSIVVSEVEVNKDGVLVLTAATFDEGITSADFTLVEFYAPWCGHCKALAPEYAKAAKLLLENHPDLSAKLAMVDATVETSLGKDYAVRGYPTLKFFNKESPKEPSEYSGGRTADEIVAWILKKTGPAAVELPTVEDAQKMIDAEQFVVIGVFENSDSEPAQLFLKVAQGMDDVKFGISNVAAVREHYGVSLNKVVVLRKFDEPKVEFEDESMTSETLKEFISNNRLPYIIEFSDENAPKIFNGAVKNHALLFCKKDESETLLSEYRKAAKTLKGKAIFVYLDISSTSNERVMEFFNLKPEDGTQFRVIKMQNEMQKFKADLSDFNEASFTAFVQDVLDDKVKRHMMTEEIPADWDKEPVKVLVGKNFEEVSLDKSKDVLVEFYAPWCGHCKALAPIYEELGQYFKENNEVVIAKIDSTKNEVSAVDVSGFPTIYLFRKDDNKALLYNGGRTLEAMKAFVESHGDNQKDDDGDDAGEGDEEGPGETEEEPVRDEL